jgi:phytoene dehydrogenase-like protein
MMRCCRRSVYASCSPTSRARRTTCQSFVTCYARCSLQCATLRVFLDCVCQITVQTSAAEAEAPFALGAMDYYFRGTGHIRGGVGVLASAMVAAIEANGGTVALASRVHGVREAAHSYSIHTRRGVVHAQALIGNLLPGAALALYTPPDAATPEIHRAASAAEVATMESLGGRVAAGWGAVMLYRVLPPPAERAPPAASALGADACHYELVDDDSTAYTEGNHVFCSVSAANETARVKVAGERTVTISTHVALQNYVQLNDREQGAYVAAVQARMRHTIEKRAPELACYTLELPASPRTFERFTGRKHGAVGGVPRRVGLHNYLQLTTPRLGRAFFLVGDSYFPGQSTLAVALGGVKAAEAAMARLPTRDPQYLQNTSDARQ